MRAGFVIALNLALMTSIVRADEKLTVLKVGNESFSNVTVLEVTATDIYFTSDRGMANAKLKDLNPELQKHFHYDATKAATVAQEQKTANAQYHQELMHAPQPPPASAADTQIYRAEPQPEKKLWANSFLSQRAPPLMVEKWLTPEPDCRGKCVLIDFWATWCPPCRRAIPELNAYQKEFGDKLVVIGITDQTEEEVRSMVEPKIEYSIAIDTQERTKKAVGVTGIPHVLILDPRGIVRWEGYPFLQGYELTEQVVASIIAEYSD